MSETSNNPLQERLLSLQLEHSDLDQVVDNMVRQPHVDQLLVRRLKKRKLQLKDEIDRLKSLLIPNLDA
ncbi:MAG: YdcH family protein [Gammaproteobacteria bacterium]|nr:YdcH family protein [Gammaproteobacteria bacterium]